MKPIDKRYQSIEEMRSDITQQQKAKKHMLYFGIFAIVLVLLCIVALLIWRVQVMDNELNRLKYARKAAVEALHEEMARTRLIQHTDTLTKWKYRWPDLTERVMAVNRFCYDYAERLDESFTTADRDRILEAMLSEWNRWQLRVNALSTAQVADERFEAAKKERSEGEE